MPTTKRKARRFPRPSVNGDVPHDETTTTVSPVPVPVKPASKDRKKRRGKRPPERIKRRVAVVEIRRLVAEAGSVEPRRALTALARAVSIGTSAAEITKPGGLLDAVIDAAENCDGTAGRANAAEAATWALAWAARSKRSSAASGTALERIVGIANAFIEAGDTIHDGAINADALDTSAINPANGNPETGNPQAVSAGFLLVLGRLFADVAACERFVPVAVAAIEREIATLVPRGGPIARTGSGAILQTVARWAGVQARAEATGDVPWGSPTRDALLSAIDTAVRLLPLTHRGEGRRGKSLGRMPPGWAAILDVASRHGVKPSLNSSASGLAIIRSGQRRRDTRILVDARGSAMHLEIVVGSRPLCLGEWSFEASADGVPLDPIGDWTDSCFESDRCPKLGAEATFAEWTLPLSRDLRLERQLVFAPQDRVLLLADAIVPADESRRAAPAEAAGLRMDLDYRGGLPVCPGIEFEAADETRELIGFDESVRLLAMPLALPEWSTAACDGRLEAEPCRLVLEQRSKVARMYAPLWLDLEPSRIGERLTWRRLTVADSRQNLPDHRACGYRIQVGGRQWLVYRGLDAVRNRSVLGCNLACEFLLGRVDRNGIVERLIEIQ